MKTRSSTTKESTRVLVSSFFPCQRNHSVFASGSRVYDFAAGRVFANRLPITGDLNACPIRGIGKRLFEIRSFERKSLFGRVYLDKPVRLFAYESARNSDLGGGEHITRLLERRLDLCE